MKNTNLRLGSAALLATLSLTLPMSAFAGTFVYVSNAVDGDIATYEMDENGKLTPGEKVEAADVVMPMAVSPDKAMLYAAARSEPYRVFAYRIDPQTGALTPSGNSPTIDSMVYISLDKTGRYLLQASYGGAVIAVNEIKEDGTVAERPLQVVPTARNPHSIRTDDSNSHLYVPSLGDDMIMEFSFDSATGNIVSNTPFAIKVDEGTGPRHFVISNDNRFLYVVSELRGEVLVFSIDGASGLLSKIGVVEGVPGSEGLKAGKPRKPVAAGTTAAPEDTSEDVWSADIKITPNDRHLYITERTKSTIQEFSIDPESGMPTRLGSVETETQPRGIAIDESGKFLIASGERSDMISVYAIQEDGALEQAGRYPSGNGANWIEIVTTN